MFNIKELRVTIFDQFRKPGPAAIIFPTDLRSGELITPYQDARK
jgi:branched-chain amino acid transport system substrate-binding protein